MTDTLHSISDTTHVKKPNRGAFWQHHINQWRDSGLSKMAYCQQHDVVYHQMVYWSGKTEKTECDAPRSSNNFVAVNVSRAEVHSGLSVQLPNGVSIVGIDEHNVLMISQLVNQL